MLWKPYIKALGSHCSHNVVQNAEHLFIFHQSNLAPISLFSQIFFLQLLPLSRWKTQEYHFMPQCWLNLHQLQREGRGGMIWRMCHDPAELQTAETHVNDSTRPDTLTKEEITIACRHCLYVLFCFYSPSPRDLSSAETFLSKDAEGFTVHLISDIPTEARKKINICQKFPYRQSLAMWSQLIWPLHHMFSLSDFNVS